MSNITRRRLIVMESEAQDNDRHLARIDPEVMNEMNMNDGDLVHISGESTTKILTCLALLPADTNRGIIRLDPDTRNEIGVKIGNKIFVRRSDSTQYPDATGVESKYSHGDDKDHVTNEPSILISGCCIDFETERPKIMHSLGDLELKVHDKDKFKCYSDGKKTLGWDFFRISFPIEIVEKILQIHPEIDKHEGITLEHRFVIWLSDRMKRRKLEYHLKIIEIPFESVSGFRLDPKNYHDSNELNNLK